jgi:hypothetical protein
LQYGQDLRRPLPGPPFLSRRRAGFALRCLATSEVPSGSFSDSRTRARGRAPTDIVPRLPRRSAPERVPAATNDRIVRLLEEVKAQLADSKKREQQIARDLARLIDRK